MNVCSGYKCKPFSKYILLLSRFTFNAQIVVPLSIQKMYVELMRCKKIVLVFSVALLVGLRNAAAFCAVLCVYMCVFAWGPLVHTRKCVVVVVE